MKTLAASVLSSSPAMRLPGVGLADVGAKKKVDVYNNVIRAQNNQIRASAVLKKAGGSLVMTLPAAVRKALGLTEGAELSLAVEGSRVVMEPVTATVMQRVRRPKYTLDELVAGMNPEAPMTEEERSWYDAAPVGREIW
ncbi:AbrB/MazE/SpoVT family DNA-binding domain-containing protein [Devosia sp. UYZn731]|uniref:AbrB/MazE/SpoVT family DNA-binding domain-containing protein n=1 Tax=Devosia sp. UYZn731 TaxID=3156345 RepID=UPI00339A521F